MRRLLFVVSSAFLSVGWGAFTSCSEATGGGTGGGGGGGGGGTGGGAQPGFTVTVLDANARDTTYFAMAVDPVAERVGVAYYTPRGTQSQSPADGGGLAYHPDYDLKYVEYNRGVVSTPETLRYVQRLVGLSLAFEPASGDPVVAYLGGDQGFVVGRSIFWFQSDAVYRRKTGSTWGPEVVVAEDSGDVPSGDPSNNVSDQGFLVGLWPSVLFAPDGTMYLAYRDGHNAEFPQQDWNGSDVELWSGRPPSLSGTMLKAGGKDKQAWGGHIQLVMGSDQPAVVYEQMFLTPDSTATNVWFQERLSSGGWSTPAQLSRSSDTQTGASIAFDPEEGFGVAFVDGSSSKLTYRNRDPVSRVWSDDIDVYGSGLGGWYPSLAMDPVYHEPAIAFYVCARGSSAAGGCPDTENELRVSQRVSGHWREAVVDAEGGYAPRIGFFASGKRFVVYRQPIAKNSATGGELREGVGRLKIAVEQ